MLDATECGTGGIQVGADTFNTATGAGSFVCTFPDGPASPTVYCDGQRQRRRPDTDTLDVTVANVKPRSCLTGSAPADEGDTNTYSFTVTDPGADTHTMTTACGANGTKVALSDTLQRRHRAGQFPVFLR